MKWDELFGAGAGLVWRFPDEIEGAVAPVGRHRKHLGSCEICHFHHSGIGERCKVHFYGEQCQGYIRECCCAGVPDPKFRNDPAPRNPGVA